MGLERDVLRPRGESAHGGVDEAREYGQRQTDWLMSQELEGAVGVRPEDLKCWPGARIAVQVGELEGHPVPHDV